MFFQRLKITHKVAIVIVCGALGSVLLGGGGVYLGLKQRVTLRQTEMEIMAPLDALRSIQREFRAIEFRMTGVMADVLAAQGAAAFLELSVRRVEDMWETAEPFVPDGEEKRNFEEGLRRFHGLSGRLRDAYRDEDLDRLSALYDEEWLEIKPLVVKTIDGMAEALHERAVSHFNENIETASRFVLFMGGVGLAVVTLFCIFGLLIVRSINRPLRVLLAGVEQVASGDFTVDLRMDSKDEMGSIAAALQRMTESLRGTFRGIRNETRGVAGQARSLLEAARSLQENGERQQGQVEQVAASATEMSQTIMDVAGNASSANETTSHSLETAQSGRKVVEQVVGSINRLRDGVEAAAASLTELGRSSREIGDIVSVIQDIADQTNLLALNAAIEAARAGEQGRGFAVVADEVRKLAEKTARATDEIAGKIGRMQGNTGDSIRVMEEGQRLADQSVEYARQAGETLGEIVQGSETVSDMVQRIAAATEQQSSAAEEVSRSMEDSAEQVQAMVRLSSGVRGSAEELRQVVGRLEEMVSRFRIPSDLSPEGADAAAGRAADARSLS